MITKIIWPDIDHTELAPLFRRYPGQSNAQDADLEIDPSRGAVSFDIDGAIGGGASPEVWHSRVLRYSVSNRITVTGMRAIAACPIVNELLLRICAGHSVEWDGSNHSGNMTEDAEDASSRLTDILSENMWTNADTSDDLCDVWEIGDWMNGNSDGDAATIRDHARDQNVHLHGDVDEYLKLRNSEKD